MSTHPNTKSNLTNPSLPNHKRVTSASSVFIPKPKHKRPLTSLSDLNKINIFRNKKDSKLDVLNLIIETNPSKYNLNKLGKTIDIARCVNWLVQDEYTTGQIISVNGGWII